MQNYATKVYLEYRVKKGAKRHLFISTVVLFAEMLNTKLMERRKAFTAVSEKFQTSTIADNTL